MPTNKKLNETLDALVDMNDKLFAQAAKLKAKAISPEEKAEKDKMLNAITAKGADILSMRNDLKHMSRAYGVLDKSLNAIGISSDRSNKFLENIQKSAQQEYEVNRESLNLTKRLAFDKGDDKLQVKDIFKDLKDIFKKPVAKVDKFKEFMEKFGLLMGILGGKLLAILASPFKLIFGLLGYLIKQSLKLFGIGAANKAIGTPGSYSSSPGRNVNYDANMSPKEKAKARLARGTSARGMTPQKAPTTFLGKAFLSIKNVFKNMFSGIGKVFGKFSLKGIVFGAVKGIFRFFGKWLLALPFVIWDALTGMFSADKIKENTGKNEKDVTWFERILSGVATVIEGLFLGLLDSKTIYKYLNLMIEEVQKLFNDIWPAIAPFKDKILDYVTKKLTDMYNFFNEFLDGIINKAKDILGIKPDTAEELKIKEIRKNSSKTEKGDNSIVDALKKSGKLGETWMGFGDNTISDYDINKLSQEEARALINQGGLSDETNAKIVKRHFSEDALQASKQTAPIVVIPPTNTGSVNTTPTSNKMKTIEKATEEVKKENSSAPVQNNSNVNVVKQGDSTVNIFAYGENAWSRDNKR